MLAKLTLLLGFLAASVAAARPNIVFIMTDDQDKNMDSLQYMKGVQQLMSEGTYYTRHYCTVALCCPSRVNLLTGRAAHNTNITDLTMPFGGYGKFANPKTGFNNDYLPIYMQEAGYQTYYVGKLMNEYTSKNYAGATRAMGWNASDFLIDNDTYNYYAPKYQRNVGATQHKPFKYTNMTYTTTITLQKGLGFMDDARAAGGPFFLAMAPVAPHTGFGPRPSGNPNQGPVPEAKYANMFNDIEVPRTENFNPNVPSGTSWLLNLPQLNSTQIAQNDNYYRNRIRALQSVDDLVNSTVAYLKQYNLLDNTYIFYTTDNGFHISQHRLEPGKNCPYEEDINIPLIIKGPGIPAGGTVEVATTHTDLTPSFLSIAGAPLKSYFDGAPLPHIDDSVDPQVYEHAQIEHWGSAGGDEATVYMPPGYKNTTYKALRIIGDGYNFYYSVWCSNQHELYDMSTDSQQMHNLYTPYSYKPNEPTTTKYPINRLESRLDAVLLVLKTCKATTCRKPWLALHPAGNVNNLNDAMNAKYDEFYEKTQNRIAYEKCRPGYFLASEQPTAYKQYMATSKRDGVFQLDEKI